MARPRKNQVTSLLDEAPAFIRQRGGSFLVIKGPDRGESVVLTKEPLVFGSSPACGMVLTDKTVSRKHMQAAWSESAETSLVRKFRHGIRLVHKLR